jgi:hypothetical protein
MEQIAQNSFHLNFPRWTARRPREQHVSIHKDSLVFPSGRTDCTLLPLWNRGGRWEEQFTIGELFRTAGQLQQC